MAKYYNWEDFDVNWEDEGFYWEEALFSYIIANVTINNSTIVTTIENNEDIDIDVSNYEYIIDVENIILIPPVEETISVSVLFSTPPDITTNISNVIFNENDDMLFIPSIPPSPLFINISMINLPNITVNVYNVEIE